MNRLEKYIKTAIRDAVSEGIRATVRTPAPPEYTMLQQHILLQARALCVEVRLIHPDTAILAKILKVEQTLDRMRDLDG